MTSEIPTSAAASAALAALPEGAGRLLAVQDSTLRVASDGLALAEKLALERGLKAALGDVKVYFARRAGAGAAAGPAPLAGRKAPFGLTFDRRAIPGVTEVIVVASGKGGVGKSTVSANLAVALAARGLQVGLLDADIYGPSAPLMMGLAGRTPATTGNQLVPLAAHGVKTVSFGFLTDTREPVIWRGPLLAKAFRQLCYDVAWGPLDYLVIDLPPGTGDVQLTLIESLPVHGALIVTTPQDVALLDAYKALAMFERLEVPVLGVVENMAGYACTCCGHVEPVFGEGGGERLAAERKVPVLARLPLDGRVRAGGDAGLPVALDPATRLGSEFARLAAAVVAGPNVSESLSSDYAGVERREAGAPPAAAEAWPAGHI